MNIELEKWLLDALKIGSSHRVVIEAFGTPGSGKSYLSRKLYQFIRKKKIAAIYTREPGGTIVAERIRNLILTDYFKGNNKQKFDKYIFL